MTDPVNGSAERAPQGITVRYMCTGNPARDYVGSEEWNRHPRVDPASLGEAPFLALPIRETSNGPPVRWRIRQYTPATAAEVLTWAPVKPEWNGIRIATDEEVAAYHAEEEKRRVAQRAEAARAARAELERQLARVPREIQADVRAGIGEGD